MIELLLVGLSKWLASSLFGGYVYDKTIKVFGKDKFESLTDEALREVLKKEENLIIWNELNSAMDLKIRDPTEFDFDQACSCFSGEYLKMCQTFFEDLEKEYLKKLFEHGKEDPITKFLMEEISRLDDFETRIRTLENLYPGIQEFLKIHDTHLKERLEDVKKVIEMKKIDIKDFVGRKDILENFPEGDVFIQGNAAYGKTYLMLLLCKQCNGYYIPLNTVKEKEIFELLIEEAREKKKRIFVDDFHLATQEIREYILSGVLYPVLASRGELAATRPFICFKLQLLEEEDIREYFSVYDIEIEEEILNLLKNDLDFPIKLKIFVNYLKLKEVRQLDNTVLETILKELGLEKFKLPDELDEFYRKFVFGLFDEQQVHLCYILSLLRSPSSVGQLSSISDFSEGKVSRLLEKMEGILDVHERRYAVFHESFREFCLRDLGDARRLNKKIGDYFKGLVGTERDLEAKIEGMYHYGICEEGADFKKVFDLSVVQFLIHVGRWDEAEKNLEFELGLSEDEKEKADTMMILGTICDRRGEWTKSMIYYKECLKIHEALKDTWGIATVYGNMGLVYYKKSEWDKAIEYFEKDQEIFEKLGDAQEMAHTYNNLGMVYYSKGEWNKAIEHYEKSLEIKEKLGNVYDMASTYNNLGMVYYSKGEWNKAIEYCKKSLEISEKLGDVGGIASAYNNLGMIYHKKGEWDKAQEYYEKSLEISEKLGDVQGVAQKCSNLGSVYNNRGEWNKALEYFEKSLEIFEKLGDSQGIADTYTNLGTIYDSKGEWNKAQEHYEKSLEIKEKLGDVQGMAQPYGNLGSVYYKKSEWDKAIEYFEKSLKIFEKLGDSQGIAHTYTNLGTIYDSKGELDKALEYYEESLEIKEKLGDVQGMALTKYGIAIILSRKKKFNEALRLFFESESILKKLGDKFNLMKVYKNLALCYEDMNQKEKANEYYQKAEELRKRLGINIGASYH